MMINSRTKKTLIICSTILLIYLLPPIIFQGSSYFSIHDNLDSYVSEKVVLANSGKAFSFNSIAPIDQIMNGIPRGCLPSGFNIAQLLFNLFPPYIAYLLNYLIVHFIAFIGMFLLLKKYFLTENDDLFIVGGASLCFAFLPIYSIFGLSIFGQPLLLYALLNIKNKRAKYSDWLIVFLYPIYSSLYYSGIFIIILLCGYLVYRYLFEKVRDVPLALAAGLLLITYIITELPLIRLVMAGGIAMHRSNYLLTGLPASQSLLAVIQTLTAGSDHAESSQLQYIIPVFLIALILNLKNGLSRTALIVTSAIAAISAWQGLYLWQGMNFIKNHISILRMIQFDRFIWLLPLLWYILFALSLSLIARLKYGKAVVILLLILQANLLITNSDTQSQLSDSIKIMRDRTSKLITFDRFFSKNLYDKIDKFIGKPKSGYRIISVGLHPAVAQFNGFYTLDSYQSLYPASYKVSFRKIIEKELNKSPRWKAYFDDWGNRCYAFSSELDGLYIRRESNLKIKHLEFNTLQFKKMGGRYILSNVEIENYKANSLQFLKKFEDKSSPWEIFLYKTI